ncbi:MAG: radical SAM protein [Chloroflexales bacterium]|nr:radical SAM protein [Chloroflexales bacterium]
MAEVRKHISRVSLAGQAIDYLTFVPDGEPTLDRNLGRTIALLRPLGYPIAVITNASLIWHRDVRDELGQADWVSLKLDAVQEDVWRRIDHPQGTVRLEAVLEGALAFAAAFKGELATETMLVDGLNDTEESVAAVAEFVARLRPATAYLAVPTRPPAEPWVRIPAEASVARAYQIFHDRVAHVEYLIGYEGDAFVWSSDVVRDLLSITAVHPMREEAVEALLARAGGDWSLVHALIAEGQLVEITYAGHRFYLRRLRGPTSVLAEH